MRNIAKNRVAAVAAGAVILTGAGATGAVAGNKIGSEDIKNGSIRSADIQNKTVKKRDIAPGLAKKMSQPGEPGPQGPEGPAGPPGERGPAGPAGDSHDITASWTANGDSSVAGYTAVLQGDNTSVETTDLGVEVEPGDIVSFEYSLLGTATCGAGGPRMFVKIGDTYENTFDAATNCGTNGEVVYVVETAGDITEAGVVHDNGSGGTVYVNDVLVDGKPVFFG